ncbi:hypothetical protein [Natronorubrum texcoconense]|uniref:Uncharacterized protein n=1 Tax=Natronorubrum texcoconense TaxID=1095776 RepID=A0A1G8TGZ0_9EURY|nr:hypothetical protein [Natronorubrum texcoconense]SDJ40697.1 hypothetical protein SAMN04515672_0463 [Natronorubrum texcoconense]
MTDRPPSPQSPTALPATATDEDRIVATTPQLTARIEDAVGCRLDESVLEELLLELDRGEYVEWVTMTRNGEYVWDLTDSPDRIADAVATVVVERFEGWLEAQLTGSA